MRSVIDLVTADGQNQQFESEARRDEVTREFRVIDAVARALAQVEGTALPNPRRKAYEEVATPVPHKVLINSIDISAGATNAGVETYSLSQICAAPHRRVGRESRPGLPGQSGGGASRKQLVADDLWHSW